MGVVHDIRSTISVLAALETVGLEPPDRVPGMIRCPVHDDDTPSMSVDEAVWYCHGCGVGGGALELIQFVGGLSFGQAVQFLSGSVDELHVAPPLEQKQRDVKDLTRKYGNVRKPTDEEKDYRHWAGDKWTTEGSNPSAVERAWAKLGEGNLWIPHTDAEGVVRGVKLRVIGGPNAGKKHAVPDSYFLSRPYRVVERPWAPLAYLVEGETDTWTVQQQVWFRPDIAVYGMPSGVMSWKPWFRPELEKHGAIVVLFDGDEAGDRGWKKVKGALPYAIRQRLPRGAKDVTEAVAKRWRLPGWGMT